MNQITKYTGQNPSWEANRQFLSRSRNWYLCSSGMLQSVGWWSVTDVAGQSIGPISIVKQSKDRRL